MLDTLFSLIAPYECMVCQAQGAVLCRVCTLATLTYVPSRCFNCLCPTQDFMQCSTCKSHYYMNSVWVCGVYKGQLKQLIHEYKFAHKRAAVQDLVTLLDALLPPIDPQTIITNVPTASSHIRERGFDHGALLAKTFARKRGLVYVSCIARTGQSRQLGLSRAERLQNIDGLFHIKSNSLIKGAKFLIIDDVVTTGASINEAAKVLKHSGAYAVNAATIAQTVM